MPLSIPKRKRWLSVRETVIFAFLGTLMCLSDLLMEALPNIHLVGVLVATFTLTYGAKALFPIYIYTVLIGLFSGFGLWWLPYLYIFTVLWALIMLTRPLPFKARAVLSHALCVLHGISFGILYAPAQALMWGLNYEGMLAWIAAGLPFDIAHAIGNFVLGFLIYPLARLLCLLQKKCQ